MYARLVASLYFEQSAIRFVQTEYERMDLNEHTVPGERQEFDVVVIGAGQAGLALGYYLRRTSHTWVVLDAETGPGGAWRHGWDSLHLFSPAQWSSLPGWPMPPSIDDTPNRDEVIAYFAAYETRYALPIERPVHVQAVRRDNGKLVIESSRGIYQARAVISASGTWGKPFIPAYPGQELFRGIQIHSANYRTAALFSGRRVLIVGGGNSGAQILAEVSEVAETAWVTLEPPRFLPDDVDGRVLFERATAHFTALQQGHNLESARGLGDIVMVPSVKDARARGVLNSVSPFASFTSNEIRWADGHETVIDAVIWCTGFRPVLDHLQRLGILEADGHIAVNGTHAIREPRLWLVGYGEWTGFASATIL